MISDTKILVVHSSGGKPPDVCLAAQISFGENVLQKCPCYFDVNDEIKTYFTDHVTFVNICKNIRRIWKLC